MTQQQWKTLPEPMSRDSGGADRYPAIWVTVGRVSKFPAKNPGEVIFALDVKGPKDEYWTFPPNFAHMAVQGAQIQVELKSKQAGQGFYQDVVKVANYTGTGGEIHPAEANDQAAIQAGVQAAQANSSQPRASAPPQEDFWRPGMEEGGDNYDSPTGPGPAAPAPRQQPRPPAPAANPPADVYPASLDHRPRQSADFNEEPPSFHSWKEVGIRKMSALKAAVAYLDGATARIEVLVAAYSASEIPLENLADIVGQVERVDTLAVRLMEELAGES